MADRTKASSNVYTVLMALTALILLAGVIFVAMQNMALTGADSPLELVSQSGARGDLVAIIKPMAAWLLG